MTTERLEGWAPVFDDERLAETRLFLQIPELRTVYDRFQFNISPHMHLPFIIGRLFFQGWEAGWADAKARREKMPGRDELTGTAEEEAEVAARRYELLRGNDFFPPLPFPETGSLPDVLRHMNRAVLDDVADLMSMQIVGAWSAFETLAGDLWVRAVDLRPDVLVPGSLKSGAVDDEDDDDDAEEMEDDTAKSSGISLHVMQKLSRGSFDLKDCMGRVLRADRHVSFTSLEKIRDAYQRAFPDSYKGIKADSIFSALNEPGLDALSLVRNVLVHRAGIADEIYRKRQNGAPLAPKAKTGELIPLNGKITKSLVESAVDCSIRLIQGVDQWLTSVNARKPRR